MVSNTDLTLVDLLWMGKDVPFDRIPERWFESFKTFMFGQAIYEDERGVSVAYIRDYTTWYDLNHVEIEREDKINMITRDGNI